METLYVIYVSTALTLSLARVIKRGMVIFSIALRCRIVVLHKANAQFLYQPRGPGIVKCACWVLRSRRRRDLIMRIVVNFSNSQSKGQQSCNCLLNYVHEKQAPAEDA